MKKQANTDEKATISKGKKDKIRLKIRDHYFNNFDLTLKTILPQLFKSKLINKITNLDLKFNKMRQLSELLKKPHELRCDYVLTDDKIIVLTEIQAQNLDNFALRNLEHFASALRQYKMPVYQIMFYIGQEPLKMPNTYKVEGVLEYQFPIIDFGKLDTKLFINQSNIYVKLLSILTKDGRAKQSLTQILEAIALIPGQKARLEAIHILTTLSNLRKDSILSINEIVEENKMPIIINPEDTDFYRIGLNRGKAEGKVEGKAEGKVEGKADTLLKLLTIKFGLLNPNTEAKIKQASNEELDHYLTNFVKAVNLEDTFKSQ